MIKITLKEATGSLFNEAISGVLQLSPPAKLSYNLTKIAKRLESEIALFNSERSKLLKKFCKLDNEGQLILNEDKAEFLNQEASASFSKELEDLLSIEFECHGIKLEDLESIKDLKGIYVTGLYPIIIEE